VAVAGAAQCAIGALWWASGPMDGDVSRAIFRRSASRSGWGAEKGGRAPLVVLPSMLLGVAGVTCSWIALLQALL
jgi:hypothetical protein